MDPQPSLEDRLRQELKAPPHRIGVEARKRLEQVNAQAIAIGAERERLAAEAEQDLASRRLAMAHAIAAGKPVPRLPPPQVDHSAALAELDAQAAALAQVSAVLNLIGGDAQEAERAHFRKELDVLEERLRAQSVNRSIQLFHGVLAALVTARCPREVMHPTVRQLVAEVARASEHIEHAEFVDCLDELAAEYSAAFPDHMMDRMRMNPRPRGFMSDDAMKEAINEACDKAGIR